MAAPVEEASIPEHIPVTVVSKKKDKKPEEAVAAAVEATPASDAAKKTVPDSWEEGESSNVSHAAAAAATVTASDNNAKAPLKLAPGGKLGGGIKKLNEPVNVRKYSKADIMLLKPVEEDFVKLQIFGPITFAGADSPVGASGGGRGGGGGGGGWMNKHSSPRGAPGRSLGQRPEYAEDAT